MKRLVVALMLASMMCLTVRVASAAEERYEDEQQYEDAFSNPLRIAYYLIYPVGFTVEWLVMRPFHYIVSRPGLDRLFGYQPIGEEGSYNRMGEHM
ncbi:MAG TPA: hypothetical protein VL049_15280 [Candidatus Dormibacteraeota bacterium]|nr:hypothetical protein [Candidatus Dormibacteraeota bacterium]